MQPHTALIDGDFYLIITCSVNEEEDSRKYVIQSLYNIVDSRIRKMRETIPSITKIYHALGSKSNFRKTINKQIKYKGTRSDKPRWFNTVKQAYIDRYKPYIKPFYEADDVVTMMSYVLKDNAVICVDDKDLDTVNTWRYVDERKTEGVVTREVQYYYVSQIEAIRNFYCQLLIGDKETDCVLGIHGIGKGKAPPIVEGFTNEYEAFIKVLEAYKKHYKDLTELEVLSLINERANLLYMSRFVGDRWLMPRKSLLLDEDRIAYNSF